MSLVPLVSLSIATTFESDSGLNALVENQDVFATIRFNIEGFDPTPGIPIIAPPGFNLDESDPVSGPTFLPLPAPSGGLRVYIDSDVPNLLDRFDLSSFVSDPQFSNIDVTSFTPNSDHSGFAVTIDEGASLGALNLRLLDNVEPDPNQPETLDGLVNATFTLRAQQEVPPDEDQITGISGYIPFPFATVNPLLLADDANQLPFVSPSEPLNPAPTIEVGISVSTDFVLDTNVMVEDLSTTVTVRFDLSEPAPEGGLRIYLETDIPHAFDRLALPGIFLNPRLENIEVSSLATDFDDSAVALTIDEGATFGTLMVDIEDNVESDTFSLAVLDGLREVPFFLETSNNLPPEEVNSLEVSGTVSDYAIDPDASSFVVSFADTASQVLLNEDEDENFFLGTPEKDLFVGTGADEQIYGRGGNDRLRGNQGDDQIFGGDGNDRLWGDQGSSDLEGGDDIIYSGAGNDVIRGGGGDDMLFGNEGDDYLRGDEGDDLLRGGDGNDRLRGDFARNRDGEDTFVLAIGEGTDTIEDFGVGEDFIGLANGLSFEQLVITQQTRKRALIEVGDETLAILNNVDADALIASADTTFTVV